MGKLSHARTHTTAPELLRIGRLKQLRLRGNQRQQPLLQHLRSGRPQRQQPHRGTELISNPAVEVPLHHVSL